MNFKQTTIFIFSFCFGFLAMAQKEEKIPTSFSLEEAKAYAVEHSYQAENAVRDVEKAKMKVKETTAIGLPQISASGSFQQFIDIPTQVLPDFVSPAVTGVLIENGLLPPSAGGGETSFIEAQFGTEFNVSGGLKLSQLLFSGSYIVALQATKTYLELSKNAAEKTAQEIKAGVTQAYGMVLIAEENQKILTKNLANLQKTFDDTKALLESGFAEQQDVDQLQLLIGNMRNTISSTKKQVEVSYNMLKFQMGIPIANEVTLTDDIIGLVEISNDQNILSKEFNPEGHIDYKIALQDVSSKELMLRNNQAGYLPSLSAFVSLNKNYLSNDLTLSNQFWFPNNLWGLNLDVPIFSSFMRRQQVQQSRVDLEQSLSQKSMVQQNLLLQAQNARANYTNALNKMNLEVENLKLAQRIKSNTEVKFKEGLASSLELTQAQNQELTSQANYISSMFEVINTKAQLDKALGEI